MLNMEYIIIPTKVIGGQLGATVFYNKDLYGEYAAASSYKLFKLPQTAKCYSSSSERYNWIWLKPFLLNSLRQ